jgi:hypothetical protein
MAPNSKSKKAIKDNEAPSYEPDDFASATLNMVSEEFPTQR